MKQFTMDIPVWIKAVLALAFAACIGALILDAWLHAGQALPKGTMNALTYGNEPVVPVQKPVYRFAVHPLHNPQRLFANFQPVIDIINREAGGEFSVRLIAARDYAFFEKRLMNGEFDFALANPLQAIWSLDRGYRLISKMGDDEHFRGLIILRRDAHIKKPTDLAGGTMIFPSPTALAATMMPRYFLHNHGLDFSSVDIGYSGSQESAIMNVYLGKADAVGTWPMPWELFLKEKPELGRQLKLQWQTEPLVNNALVSRPGLPEEHVGRLVDILLNLDKSAEGRAALAGLRLSSFDKIDPDEYTRKVKNFLKDYEKAFPEDASVNELDYEHKK